MEEETLSMAEGKCATCGLGAPAHTEYVEQPATWKHVEFMRSSFCALPSLILPRPSFRLSTQIQNY